MFYFILKIKYLINSQLYNNNITKISKEIGNLTELEELFVS